MKLLLLLLLLCLLAGTVVGALMLGDAGYVLIHMDGTTIETTFWVFCLTLLVLFFVLHVVLNMLRNLNAPVKKLKAWNAQQDQMRAKRKTEKGLIHLARGDWKRARRELGQVADHASLPLLNYLAAAQAAQQQGDDAQADEFLHKARGAAPEADVAIKTVQAQLQLNRKEYEPCLANLLQLRKDAPESRYVTGMLRDVYTHLSDWQALVQLLPELRQQELLDNLGDDDFALKCYVGSLEQAHTENVNAGRATRLTSVRDAWQKIPFAYMRKPQVIDTYVDILRALDGQSIAEASLRTQLLEKFDPHLFYLYGTVQGEDAKKQFRVASQWEKNHADDPTTHLTLGRLAARTESWGQAVAYLERSLELQYTGETLTELVRVLHQMGDTGRVGQLIEQNIKQVTMDIAPGTETIKQLN